MPDEHKTIFISYRRSVASFIARSIFIDLRANGYDVFMDVESINSGQFDTIILRQIEARAHFVVLLTPGTVERCVNADDWLRREVEYAMEKGRNIVPLFINGFEFNDDTRKYLTGNLAELPRYNGMSVPHDYFDEAMTKLRNRFLKQPVSGVVRPAPESDQSVVEQKIQETIREANVPKEIQLIIDNINKRPLPKSPTIFDQVIAAVMWGVASWKWYIIRKTVAEKKISVLTKILSINPQHVNAYHYRALARHDKGDSDGAIADYSEALRLNPQNIALYNNRGGERHIKGDFDGAIADYSEALHLDPQYAMSYCNRGTSFREKGQIKEAVADYTTALDYDARYVNAYLGRGITYFVLAKFDQAMSDFRAAASIRHSDEIISADLAVTHYALGQKDEAKGIWRMLLSQDQRFHDADRIGKELRWAKPLIEAARELIAEL